MVILIGGCSCTGKTYLADMLLKKYKIPYFSIDYLKMGLYRSGMSFGYTPTSSDELIAKKLWPIIKEMIMTYIENKQTVIIEGCYLLPNYIRDFPENYKSNILSIFLGFTKNYITNNFNTGILKNRCVIEKRIYQEDRTKDDFIKMHINFKEKCKLENENFFEIDCNYEKEIESIIKYIGKNL